MTLDIIVQFNGQAMCVPGLTAFTTCDDVKEMVLYGCRENSSSYGIYETSCGIERRLPGRDSIVKVVRSWGVDKRKFGLVIRKVDSVETNVVNASNARRKLQKMRVEEAKRSETKEAVTRLNLNKDSNKEMKSKVILTSSKGSRVKRNQGKLDLMKRFLKDAMTQQEQPTNCVLRSRLSRRTMGDGCDDSVINLEDNLANDSGNAFEDESDCSSVCDLERNILEHELDSDIVSNDDDSTDKANNTVQKCDKIRKMFSGSDIMNSGPDSEDADMESFMKTVIY